MPAGTGGFMRLLKLLNNLGRQHINISGTTKMHRLEENTGAVAIGFTDNDLSEIEEVASKITIQGARYPEHIERMTGL